MFCTGWFSISQARLAGSPEANQQTQSLPDGTIQAKGIRNVGYMGPGNAAINPYHHYTLELYALDSMLTLGPDATRAEVMTAMAGHIVGKAVLVGRFKRPQ